MFVLTFHRGGRTTSQLGAEYTPGLVKHGFNSIQMKLSSDDSPDATTTSDNDMTISGVASIQKMEEVIPFERQGPLL